MQVNAFDVGCLKTGFGRTPGVETIMVDTVLFRYLEIVPPSLHIHCGMGNQREDTGVMFSAQERSLAIHGELPSFCFEIAQAESRLLRIDRLICF